MADKTQTIQVGPGFTGLLTIVFVIAKLTGHLNWSWWWVFCPIWIPLLVVLAMVLIFLVVGLIMEATK